MATSMGPNFTGHPAGMGHPGVAGHPMGPGMPPNSAQGAPGGGMPQQFAGAHMVGPGGQVNPALMGAMPPGANPHAHALQHLNPAQQQMFQQQHQQQLQNQCRLSPMEHMAASPITFTDRAPLLFSQQPERDGCHEAATTPATSAAAGSTSFHGSTSYASWWHANGHAAEPAQPTTNSAT